MADGDINLATLWVPVVPSTEGVGPALEEAGKEAKGRFGEAVKDIGKSITDDLSQAGSKAKDTFSGIGTAIHDTFAKAGSDGGKALSDNFKSSSSILEDFAEGLGTEVGTALGRNLGDALRSIPGVSGAIETAQNWGQVWIGASGRAREGITSVHDALTSLRGGDVQGALSAVSASLGHIDDLGKAFGVDISGWSSPLQDTVSKMSGAKDQIHGFADIASGLPGKFGKVGESIAALAGPLGAAVVLGKQLADFLEPYIEKAPGYGFGERFLEHFGLHAPGAQHWDQPPAPTPSVPPNPADGGSFLPSLPSTLTGGPSAGAPAPFAPMDTGGAPGSSGSGGASNFYKSWYPQASGSSASGLAPVAAPAAASSGGTNWDALAQAESSGNWANADTGGTGHYGGLQFDLPTWRDFGGTEFAPRPDMATRDQQITVANRVPVSQRPQRWAQTWWTQSGSGGGGGGRSVGGGGTPSIASSFAASSGGMSDFGAAAGNPTIAPPDENSIRTWVQQNFGIPNTLGTGSWENAAHDYDGGWHHRGLGGSTVKSGYGFDFHGTPQQMSALANWVAQNYSQDTLELIYGGAGFDRSREIKNAKFGDVYGPGLNAEHTDHVHWAMSRMPGAMSGGMSGMGGNMPVGTEHDPIYVTQAAGGTSGGSPFQNQGQQLGQGLVSGVLQMFGLDGSVFGGKSPLDWGAVKLGGRVANTLFGMARNMSGAGPMGIPGMPGGGGGLLGGLGGLIPSPAAISAAAKPAGGSIGVGAATGTGPQNLHIDNSMNVTGNTVGNTSDLVQQFQWQQNATVPGSSGRTQTILSGVP